MSKRVKKPVAPRKKANGYKMPAPIPIGEVIVDAINKKKWRIGPSIGVGGFGEIYSACDDGASPKKTVDFPFVIKIEPHENGPLFVEKHFYVRNANKEDITTFMKEKKLSRLGMPLYFGNGSHVCNGEKYRYLVLERYGKDVWSLFKDSGRVFPSGTVFQIGLQMLDVLEYIHTRGYVHADIKGANILLGRKKGTENQAYLVDFGLATRINEKDFKPDPKCAHNGTIEYTSRDAHLGTPTMRGDLEILGYNMLQWIVGELPWEHNLKEPKTVQDKKELFMKQVKSEIAKLNHDIPEALIKFFEYINTMKPKDTPDYAKCRRLFETYLKSENKTRNSQLDFSTIKKKSKVNAETNGNNEKTVKTKTNKKTEQNGVLTKPKRGRKPKDADIEESDDENKNPDYSIEIVPARVRRTVKRKSMEPAVVVKVKKTKMLPKKTPPPKSFANTATQTSVDKNASSQSVKQVSFDSPVCAVIHGGSTHTSTDNSSGDIFEDSFVIEKVKPKRRLLAKKEITVTRVVKKKVTSAKQKGKSWKETPTVTNGRSPPT